MIYALISTLISSTSFFFEVLINAGSLSANDIIDKNIKKLKSKFGIDNIPIETDQLSNVYWIPKMHKNPIKARIIVVSPKFSIKPLVSTIRSVFHLFLDKSNHIMISVSFLQALALFG